MNLGPNDAESSQDEGASCTDIIECFNECESGNRACLDTCFEAGTESGQQALQDLSDCYQTNNCQDQTCADAHCL